MARSHEGRRRAGERGAPTPCPSKRRRTVAEAPTQQARPTWAETQAEGARKDIGAFQKKMVCRLYYSLEKMISEAGGPLVKNQDWPDATMKPDPEDCI